MNIAFLIIESCGVKVGIRHDAISAYKITKQELTLHMMSGASYTYHVSLVKNLIDFLENNSLLIDKSEEDEK